MGVEKQVMHTTLQEGLADRGPAPAVGDVGGRVHLGVGLAVVLVVFLGLLLGRRFAFLLAEGVEQHAGGHDKRSEGLLRRHALRGVVRTEEPPAEEIA
eukprot:2849196-Rhodomonas_salina.1